MGNIIFQIHYEAAILTLLYSSAFVYFYLSPGQTYGLRCFNPPKIWCCKGFKMFRSWSKFWFSICMP